MFKFFLTFAYFILIVSPNYLYARANQEEKAGEKRNPEWILMVTSFDMGSLPESRHAVGALVMKSLVDNLNRIANRIRVDPEYTFYQGHAWARDRATASQNLAKKQEDRSALLFQGNPNWRYRRDLNKIEKEIKDLEEKLNEIDRNAPLINTEPRFKVYENNLAGHFPAPPREGAEYQFCINNKIDGFLTGRIIEFHGRLYVTLQVYTRYSQSFIYEDYTIFSIENSQEGADALAFNVVSAVSGAPLSAITVQANPENATILINGSFLATGSIVGKPYPFGEVKIEGFAEGYERESFPLKLNADELAELYINLKPLSLEAFSIISPQEARVYRGALYIGNTPLEVEAPSKRSTFFHIETSDEKSASVIRQAGSADSLFLTPNERAERRVARARRAYYGAWARFWIALPTAFLIQGISDAQTRAYNTTQAENIHESALRGQYISIGAWVLFGLVSAEVLFRTGVYIYNSWKDTDPLAK